MAKRAQRLIEYYYEFTGGSNDPVPEGCHPQGEPETKPATSLDSLEPLYDKEAAPVPYDPDAIGEHGDGDKACCAACALTGGCCQDDAAGKDAEAETDDTAHAPAN